MKIFFSLFLTVSFCVASLFSWGQETPLTKQPQPVHHTQDGNVEILSGILVAKPAINKIGKSIPNATNYYLRASIQDYFIKFCESKITNADLAAYTDKSVSLEIIKKTGEWDHCPGDPEVQSRTGTYVQVLRIIRDE